MKIEVSSDVPDGTYFRASECEPSIKDDTLTIYDGNGRSRSWGRPGVTSTIVYQDEEFVSIHVGFHHKHGGGQFWRHYSVNGQIKQVAWKDLDDSLRSEILDSWQSKAPKWAKAPGKQRKDYQKPSQVKMTTYKAVAVDGKELTSLYDKRVEYHLGKRLVEAVGERAGQNYWGDIAHDGGWYSYPSIEGIKELLKNNSLVPERCLIGVKKLAIIKCEISGRVVQFPNGKLASTYLTPVTIIEEIEL